MKLPSIVLPSALSLPSIVGPELVSFTREPCIVTALNDKGGLP